MRKRTQLMLVLSGLLMVGTAQASPETYTTQNGWGVTDIDVATGDPSVTYPEEEVCGAEGVSCGGGSGTETPPEGEPAGGQPPDEPEEPVVPTDPVDPPPTEPTPDPEEPTEPVTCPMNENGGTDPNCGAEEPVVCPVNENGGTDPNCGKEGTGDPGNNGATYTSEEIAAQEALVASLQMQVNAQLMRVYACFYGPACSPEETNERANVYVMLLNLLNAEQAKLDSMR